MALRIVPDPGQDVRVVAFDPSGPAFSEGIYGLPHTAESARVVLVPVPWEPTTSYGKGTALGPSAILRASRQVDLFDLETGKPYEAGIAMLDVDPRIARANAEACAAAEPVIAAGGRVDGDPDLMARLATVNRLSVEVNTLVRDCVDDLLARGKIAGVVGGDHAAPFGCIEAYAKRYPGIGILHVDAHADLRAAYEGFVDSHASIMRNVSERLLGVSRFVHVGVRDLCEEEHDYVAASRGRHLLVSDASMAEALASGETFTSFADRIVSELPRRVYVSFDIDGLDPTLCPHTGTPVPGGLSFHQAVLLLRAVVQSGRRIVGFDLCEVAPGPEGDEWDGNVGARILYKLIGYALKSSVA